MSNKRVRTHCRERVPTCYKKDTIRLNALQIRHDAFKRKINVFFLKVGVRTQLFEIFFSWAQHASFGSFISRRDFVQNSRTFLWKLV